MSSATAVPSAEIHLVSEETDTYGAGSLHESDVDNQGRILQSRDLNAKHFICEKIVNHYYVGANAAQKSDEENYYFRDSGSLNYETKMDWNLNGGLTSYEFKSFNFYGGLRFDHLSKYELSDHVESTWNPHTYGWDSMTIPYKPVTSAGTPATSAVTNAVNYYLPQSQKRQDCSINTPPGSRTCYYLGLEQSSYLCRRYTPAGST